MTTPSIWAIVWTPLLRSSCRTASANGWRVEDSTAPTSCKTSNSVRPASSRLFKIQLIYSHSIASLLRKETQNHAQGLKYRMNCPEVDAIKKELEDLMQGEGAIMQNMCLNRRITSCRCCFTQRKIQNQQERPGSSVLYEDKTIANIPQHKDMASTLFWFLHGTRQKYFR